jgi:FMN-binding domain
VRTRLVLFLLLAAAPVMVAAVGEAGRYLTTQEFLHTAFADDIPAPATLWLSGELRDSVEDMIGHPFGSLRLRYWYDGTTSAWILDEIGKEKPITIGVTVRDDAIVAVRILEFRESRGWEVRYPFFTDQFRHAKLRANGHLDRDVDGITGATLSVAAVTRMARVALLLHDTIDSTD